MKSKRWTAIDVDEKFAADPRQWLAGHASPGKPWLLVHADDGVIWGRREADGDLRLSSEVFDDQQRYPAIAVKLRAQTLQQARVFGPDGELLVWRTDNGFAARLIEDGQDPPEDALPEDEEHLLWGLGEPPEPHEGFTLFAEGQQGLVHAPPIAIRGSRRPRLKVRHYLDYDEEGQAYVCLSRLVDIVA